MEQLRVDNAMTNSRADNNNQTWQEQKNCLGVDPGVFFPESDDSTNEAKRICRGCVVRPDCLEYALTNGEKYGVWGGLSEGELRRLRNRRARTARFSGPLAASANIDHTGVSDY